MNTPGTLPDHERRRFPRYYVNTRLTLAIEDKSLNESIGIGEPGDISLGGIRVCNLPACPNVRVGDQLGLLLMDHEEALSLHGEVVHHGTPGYFWCRVSATLSDRSTSGRRNNRETVSLIQTPGAKAGNQRSSPNSRARRGRRFMASDPRRAADNFDCVERRRRALDPVKADRRHPASDSIDLLRILRLSVG